MLIAPLHVKICVDNLPVLKYVHLHVGTIVLAVAQVHVLVLLLVLVTSVQTDARIHVLEDVRIPVLMHAGPLAEGDVKIHVRVDVKRLAPEVVRLPVQVAVLHVVGCVPTVVGVHVVVDVSRMECLVN